MLERLKGRRFLVIGRVGMDLTPTPPGTSSVSSVAGSHPAQLASATSFSPAEVATGPTLAPSSISS